MAARHPQERKEEVKLSGPLWGFDSAEREGQTLDTFGNELYHRVRKDNDWHFVRVAMSVTIHQVSYAVLYFTASMTRKFRH